MDSEEKLNDDLPDEPPFEYDPPYVSQGSINFSIITNGLKRLPFFIDDLFLGMQAMNVGLVDPVITNYEYELLRTYLEIERTPTQLALLVSAFSQMWIFGLYEVLRMWRDRRFQFKKLKDNGGIDSKLAHMEEKYDDNLTSDVLKRQLARYKVDEVYQEEIELVWSKIELVYRMVELFRMNLAKHCSPGKEGVLPRAPGYGRINMWCGAMDYELINKEEMYSVMNRRDIADFLRKQLS